MKCNKCMEELKENQTFCSKCGEKVNQVSEINNVVENSSVQNMQNQNVVVKKKQSVFMRFLPLFWLLICFGFFILSTLINVFIMVAAGEESEMISPITRTISNLATIIPILGLVIGLPVVIIIWCANKSKNN